jgi:manganese/zinc/iron transport system ATP- binding protein
MNSKPALDIADLTVAYRDEPVLWDIDLEVPEGSLMAVIGPNGAGKSTLIKTVLGLIKPVAGNILVYGDSYKNKRKFVGYVPQRSSVDWDFPTTVFDVVLMGSYGKLGWIKRPGKKEKALAREAIEKVGMEEYSGRQINELSGGQQQRTFLARALVQQSGLYLMDEPFSGVDAKTEKAILKILKELNSQGKTILVVHHDLLTVKEYFESVAMLNTRLITSGKIEEVFTEDNIRKTYGGNVNLIKAQKNAIFKEDFF